MDEHRKPERERRAAADAELGRWARGVYVIERLDGVDDAARELVWDYVADAFRNPWRVRTGPGRWEETDPRHPAALALFFHALPADLRGVAAKALAWDPDDRDGDWAGDWVRAVVWGRTRIPPGVTGEAMRAVASCYADPAKAEHKGGDGVCVNCGLRWPEHEAPPATRENPRKLLPGRQPFDGKPGPWYDLPKFFRQCPHCGGAEWTWESLMEKAGYPWKADLERELAEALLREGE